MRALASKDNTTTSQTSLRTVAHGEEGEASINPGGGG
jgi:hypothetical protein